MTELATQSRLAEIAGVTPLTIRRALKGERGVSAKTRDRIRELAKDIGYRPNVSARAIREGKTRTVTLLMSSNKDRSLLPRHMLYGIQKQAIEYDMRINVAMIDDQQLEDESFVPKVLSELHSDGLLINYHKHPPMRLQELIDRYRIPSIWLNVDTDHDAVRPDDFGAGVNAARQLLALGHTRIWYVDYGYRHDWNHYSELHRRDGYCQAMRDSGIEPICINHYHAQLGTENPDCKKNWLDVLKRSDRPTAFVIYGDSFSSTILPHVATKAGLEIPEDLSIVSFGSETRFNAIHVDTWMVPELQVGRAGFEMLMNKIDQPTNVIPSLCIPFELFKGESTSRLPEASL